MKKYKQEKLNWKVRKLVREFLIEKIREVKQENERPEKGKDEKAKRISYKRKGNRIGEERITHSTSTLDINLELEQGSG